MRPTEKGGLAGGRAGFGLLCDDGDKRVKLSLGLALDGPCRTAETAGHDERAWRRFLGRQVADLQALLAREPRPRRRVHFEFGDPWI